MSIKKNIINKEKSIFHEHIALYAYILLLLLSSYKHIT